MDVVDRADLETLRFIINISLARQKNHGDVPRMVGRFQTRANFVPIHLRHHDIQENQVRELDLD